MHKITEGSKWSIKELTAGWCILSVLTHGSSVLRGSVQDSDPFRKQVSWVLKKHIILVRSLSWISYPDVYLWEGRLNKHKELIIAQTLETVSKHLHHIHSINQTRHKVVDEQNLIHRVSDNESMQAEDYITCTCCRQSKAHSLFTIWPVEKTIWSPISSLVTLLRQPKGDNLNDSSKVHSLKTHRKLSSWYW